MSDGGKGSKPRPLGVDQKVFDNNFDTIFRKKDPICDICGKVLDNTKECAFTSCPMNWDEDRIDVIGPNGNDGLHY